MNQVPLPLDINRVLKLEQENSQLRAMISTRDSEIMDIDRDLTEAKKLLYRAQSLITRNADHYYHGKIGGMRPPCDMEVAIDAFLQGFEPL